MFFHCTAENCAYIGLSIALDKQWNLSHCYAINNTVIMESIRHWRISGAGDGLRGYREWWEWF